MSYRTYVNDTQVFGNDECYSKWMGYIKSKGIEINVDGCYEGELDDFMEALDVIEDIVIDIEKERRENKANGLKYRNTSIFDLSNIYDDVVEFPNETSLLDEELHYLECGYMFMPYAFYKACEDVIEFKGYSFKSKHDRVYRLKDGCKIRVSAG